MSLPRSLQAAVRRLDLSDTGPGVGGVGQRPTGVQGGGWQQRAWRMFEEVGELQAVTQWVGNVASQVGLYAAEATGAGAPVPTGDKTAQRVVADLAGGAEGQAQLLRQAAVLLTVVGEFYVAIIADEETGDEAWHIVPADRVKVDHAGGWQVTLEGRERPVDPEVDSIFRVHVPNPRRPEEPHSAVRSALPILEEIRAMDKVIEADARSRVSGAGILLVPTEAQLPGGDPMGGVSPASSFTRRLYEIMRAASDDQSSPEAVTPIVVRTPADTAEAFRHVTLESKITERALDTRRDAIQRLAMSLDVPPEILTGMGNSTHWNAEIVDENSLRAHIGPLIRVVCEALTVAVVRPVLEHEPMLGVDPSLVVVGYDMRTLAAATDNTDTALAAFDRGAISQQALRRELGFDPQDAPGGVGEQERLRQIAEGIVTRAPSLFPQLAGVLGFPEPEGGYPGVEGAGGGGR